MYTRLTPKEAGHARRVLLRLITPGDGTQDTRRPIDSGELDFADPDDISRLLTALAAARLITLDSGNVDLAHEH
ncbi:hypothetical protein ACH4SP_12005 [Streptomyces sp. NPDC021093]|uniref:nSTAND1 domain-containing NTPase n=1 Tax=Streptomyces sp. NPDC021093 TaxID=3365112 RepID=UPI0037B986BE